MIETLALLPSERVDRRRAEELFDLRPTAAKDLLRRLGAELCGHSLVISRDRLMARLREIEEHPDWRWERERRERIRARIDDLRPASRRSIIRVDASLQEQIDRVAIAGLPLTIQFTPGRVSVECRDMQHFVEQMVLIAKALDTDYESMRQQIEGITRKPINGENFHLQPRRTRRT